MVQTAEDARAIAVKKMEEARNREERKDSADALAIRKRKPMRQRVALNAHRLMQPMRNLTLLAPSPNPPKPKSTWPQASKHPPMP